ncbi:MAG: hypothetical protein LBU85_01375, partial [Treponema sp.]|nr:hypothetical protein [Treponema sp.]
VTQLAPIKAARYGRQEDNHKFRYYPIARYRTKSRAAAPAADSPTCFRTPLRPRRRRVFAGLLTER